MAIGYGSPAPKPEPMARTKRRADRKDAERLKAFRDAVWAREAQKIHWPYSDFARCQACHAWVSRTSTITGEVHHRIGRRAKATRYDPNNGVLLCNRYVNDCHGKAQRHEIEV